jgi:hypothetical protein
VALAALVPAEHRAVALALAFCVGYVVGAGLMGITELSALTGSVTRRLSDGRRSRPGRGG